MEPLAYATPTPPGRPKWANARTYTAIALCGAMLGCVIAAAYAGDLYNWASALPGQRVTAVQKLDRVLTRAIQGRQLTYASAPAFYAVLISEIVHGAALFVLFLNVAAPRGSVQRWRVIAALAASGPVLIAWAYFLRNVTAVETAFTLTGTVLNRFYLVFPFVLAGNAVAAMTPLVLLWRGGFAAQNAPVASAAASP